MASYVSALETASQEKPELKNVLILSQGTLMPVYQQGVEGYPIALEIWGARVGKVYNAAEKTSNFYQVTWKGTEQVVSYTLTKPTKVDLTTDGKVLTDADYGYHLVDGQELTVQAGREGVKQLTRTYQVNAQDGSLSQPSVLSEIKTAMEERVIKVGTKTPAAPSEDKLPEAPIASTTSKEILPYKQVVEEDDSLDKGKQYVRVTGQKGKREVTTYQTILDGQVVTETSKVTSETPAVDEVLVVGTKDISSVSEISPSQESLPEAPITSKTNEEELPYKQVIEEDSNLEKGKQFVRVKGQNGKRQIMTYQTIVDGQVAAETSKVTSETPAVDEVLVVGTKDISSLPNEIPLPSPREEGLTEHSNRENGKEESLTKMDNLSKCYQLSQIL